MERYGTVLVPGTVPGTCSKNKRPKSIFLPCQYRTYVTLWYGMFPLNPSIPYDTVEYVRAGICNLVIVICTITGIVHPNKTFYFIQSFFVPIEIGSDIRRDTQTIICSRAIFQIFFRQWKLTSDYSTGTGTVPYRIVPVISNNQIARFNFAKKYVNTGTVRYGTLENHSVPVPTYRSDKIILVIWNVEYISKRNIITHDAVVHFHNFVQKMVRYRTVTK